MSYFIIIIILHVILGLEIEKPEEAGAKERQLFSQTMLKHLLTQYLNACK